MMFPRSASARFGKIEIKVVQSSAAQPKGRINLVQKSRLSANSERPNTSRRSDPLKPTGSGSQDTAAPAATARTDAAAKADPAIDDARPDVELPRNDDEDEKMFPDFVDTACQQAIVPFDVIDDEDLAEDAEYGIEDEYEGEDQPMIEYDTSNPDLSIGTRFQNMEQLRNALIWYCIKTTNDYEIVKSEPSRLTIQCPDAWCLSNLHATTERGKKMVVVIG